MATIYQNANGDSVYDFGGQTINAKTGQVYVPPSPAGSSAPAPAPQPVNALALNAAAGIGPQATQPAPTPPPQPAPYTPPPAPAPAPAAQTQTTTQPKVNADGTVQSTNPNLQQYSFKTLPNGNIDIYENGKSIYGAGSPGVASSYAATLGYSAAPGQVAGASTTGPTQPTLGSSGSLTQNSQNAIGPTIPSTALGTGSSNSSALLSKAQGLYDSYAGYQKQLLDASTPSAEETAARDQIRQLNTKLAQGIAKINTQAIPEPLIGLQSNKLDKQIAEVVKPLQDELTTLVEARSSKVDAITRVMQGTPELLQMLGNIQKLTMPNVLGTQVNQSTGEVYAITQGADGALTTTSVGNIGSNNAGKAYTQSGTYQAGDGTQYFYGVKADGSVDNVQLQGGAGAGGSGGFTLGSGQTRYDAQGNPIATAPTSGGGSFTQTQKNKGASNAGLPLADFSALDANTQNFFINGYGTFTALQKKIDSGEMTKQEAAGYIQSSSSLTDSAKKILLNILGVGTADASSGSGGGGFWNTVGNIFSGAASAVGNFLGF